MAEIELRKETFSMVKLDIFDRIKIKSVIEEYCHINNLSLKDLAKELNVSRAQLYNIFDARLIDLQTLITLQKKFNFSIIKASEVEEYLSKLEFDLLRIHQDAVLTDNLDSLSRKSYKSEWLQNFRFLKVNSYYAFLYLRFISNFLWFDDRKYLKNNFQNLPFWNKKYLRDSQSIYRIQEYANARDILAKDIKYQKSLNEEEINYLKELQDSLDKDKNMIVQDLDKLNNFDSYICKKISEFTESALISQNSSPNNTFGFSLDFVNEPLEIQTHKEFINIPIGGNTITWKKYDAFVRTIILERKLNKNIQQNHIEYHKNFMKEVKELIKKDVKNAKTIDKKLPKHTSERKIRYINLFPSELNSYSKDGNHNQLLIDRDRIPRFDYLDLEATLLIHIKKILYENNWGFDEDFIGSTLGNKVYYSDIIAHEKKYESEDKNKSIQITLKVFSKKNTLQLSTLERILKTTEKGGWDKHIIFSNLPFPEKCIEFVKRTNIYLLLDTELDKLMDTILN